MLSPKPKTENIFNQYYFCIKIHPRELPLKRTKHHNYLHNVGVNLTDLSLYFYETVIKLLLFTELKFEYISSWCSFFSFFQWSVSIFRARLVLQPACFDWSLFRACARGSIKLRVNEIHVSTQRDHNFKFLFVILRFHWQHWASVWQATR